MEKPAALAKSAGGPARYVGCMQTSVLRTAITVVAMTLVGLACSSAEPSADSAGSAVSQPRTEAAALEVAAKQDEAFLEDDLVGAFGFYESSCRERVDYDRFAISYRLGVDQALANLGAASGERFESRNPSVRLDGNEAWVTTDLYLGGELIYSEGPADADRYIYDGDQWWATCDLIESLVE